MDVMTQVMRQTFPLYGRSFNHQLSQSKSMVQDSLRIITKKIDDGEFSLTALLLP